MLRGAFLRLQRCTGVATDNENEAKETDECEMFHEISRAVEDTVGMSLTLARQTNLDKPKWTLLDFEAL